MAEHMLFQARSRLDQLTLQPACRRARRRARRRHRHEDMMVHFEVFNEDVEAALGAARASSSSIDGARRALREGARW
jgi:hypothetical protein